MKIHEQNALLMMQMKMKMKIMMHKKMKIVMMLTTTECRPLSTPMSFQKHMKLCVPRAGSQHTCRVQDQDFNVVLRVCCLMFSTHGIIRLSAYTQCYV